MCCPFWQLYCPFWHLLFINNCPFWHFTLSLLTFFIKFICLLLLGIVDCNCPFWHLYLLTTVPFDILSLSFLPYVLLSLLTFMQCLKLTYLANHKITGYLVGTVPFDIRQPNVLSLLAILLSLLTFQNVPFSINSLDLLKKRPFNRLFESTVPFDTRTVPFDIHVS